MDHAMRAEVSFHHGAPEGDGAWTSDLKSDHIKHMILFRRPPLMVHDKNIPTQLIGHFLKCRCNIASPHHHHQNHHLPPLISSLDLPSLIYSCLLRWRAAEDNAVVHDMKPCSAAALWPLGARGLDRPGSLAPVTEDPEATRKSSALVELKKNSH